MRSTKPQTTVKNVYQIGSGELTFEIIERIINENLKLELAPEARERIQKCRDYLYGGEKLTFRTRPDANSPIAFTVEEEIGVSYVDMVKGWIKVKYTPKKSRKSLIGWVETKWLCPNPVTTCP